MPTLYRFAARVTQGVRGLSADYRRGLAHQPVFAVKRICKRSFRAEAPFAYAFYSKNRLMSQTAAIISRKTPDALRDARGEAVKRRHQK